jgi:hypothetical protein
METRSMQVWPRGTCYVIGGNSHDVKTRRLKNAHSDKPQRWRRGTTQEWRQVRIEELAEMYADRDVLACQSSLVDDLVKACFEGFQVDNIENFYPDASEWEIAQCREYLTDHGHGTPNDNDDVDAWRDAVRDNAEPAEVFEWWLVSSWLCDQLKKIGETVIDNGQGRWWGRTCTGQGFIMDGILQRVAASFSSFLES